MVKQRTSQFPSCKSAASLSSTLILVLLIMFSFVVLILLALGILLMPGSSSGYRPKANDLALIVGNTVDRSKGDEGRREQLVEIISWKPRAFAYHSFLQVWTLNFPTSVVHRSRHYPGPASLQETSSAQIPRLRSGRVSFLRLKLLLQHSTSQQWRRKGASALLVSPPDAWVFMEHHMLLSVNILRILFDE